MQVTIQRNPCINFYKSIQQLSEIYISILTNPCNTQGSIIGGILAFGMGGSGDKERKWEEIFLLSKAKIWCFCIK